MAALAFSAAAASSQITDGSPLVVSLHAKQNRTLDIAGTPGSVQLFEIELQGGLIWIRSGEAPARMLDLGSGANLLYALRIPSDGSAHIELHSGETLRDAHLSLRQVTAAHPEQQREHLYAAELDFALAETARRHQAGVTPVSNPGLHYDRAATEARAGEDVPLLQWIMTQKARFLMYQRSNYEVPREILLEAAALHSDNNHAVEAMIYKTLSSCEYFMGHLDAAIADAEHALLLYRHTGDVYWQGVVLGNLIADYSEMGRDKDATAAAREALTDAEQTEDTAGVVFCLTELANLYRLQGDPQRAFHAFREAESWSSDLRYAPLIQAEIQQGLGQFYMDMGLWSEAQLQLERCLRSASPDSPAALEARALLAEALRRQQRGRSALDEFDSAIAAAKRLKLQPQEAALRIERAQALLLMYRVAPARQDAEEALRLANTLSDPTLRIAATLARASVEGTNCVVPDACKQAEQLFREALALMQQTKEHAQESIAYAGLAQTEARLGKNEEALQALEESLTQIEHSRASLSSNVIAASYFEQWGDWYGLAERIALRLDRAHPGMGYREIAFRYTERARARAMLAALGKGDSTAAAELSPEQRKQIAANEETIRREQAQLVKTGSAQVAAALKHLYNEQDKLAAATQGAGETQAGATTQHIASLEDVQHSLLNQSSALLSFVPGSERSERWLVTNSSVQVRSLPSAEELRRQLEPLRTMLAARRPEPLAGENADEYTRRVADFKLRRDHELERAGALLLSGLPPALKQLYIIADGDALSLPWSALRLPCGTRSCYVVELFAVSLEPSASIAVELAHRAPQSHRDTMLLVSGAAPLVTDPSPRWNTLPALPGSQREAQAIEQVAFRKQVRKLQGREATPDDLRAELNDHIRVLHLATHTFLVPGHPELSGIALSPNSSSDKNSVLWLHDIPSLHAPPLVVLSGCTTQGHVLAGEDIQTLTQAFFYGGAQQVVASLWSVDDTATVDLMSEFYRNLVVRQAGAAESLRSAQRRMLAKGADLSDWSGFVVDGVSATGALPEAARN